MGKRDFFFHPWFFKYNHGERIGNAKENFPSKKEKMGNNISIFHGIKHTLLSRKSKDSPSLEME